MPDSEQVDAGGDINAIKNDLKNTLEAIGYAVDISDNPHGALAQIGPAPDEAVARGLQAALNQVAARHGLPMGGLYPYAASFGLGGISPTAPKLIKFSQA